MQTEDASVFTIALVLVVLFIYIACYQARSPSPPPCPECEAAAAAAAHPVDKDAAAIVQRLVDRGASLYGAGWCGFTVKQLQELGITADSTQGLDYVDCVAQKDVCHSKQIEAFPTWQINGQMHSGYYTVKELASML